MISLTLKERTSLLLVLMLTSLGAKGHQNPKQDGGKQPSLEIRLRDLGYDASEKCGYAGTGIPRDLSVLNDDSRKRLTFVDDKTLVVYQSHCRPEDQKGVSPESTRSMEAFFVSPQTGLLISRKSWPTIKRRWLNERWDTQARVMAVQGGFLIHAGNSLVVYSPEQEQKAKLALEDGPRWAVSVVPSGGTIHLQRIQDNNQAEGEWLTANSLKKLRNQNEPAGITSASEEAVVNKLAHCVQLQAVGEPPRNLYCLDPAHLGLPMFLADSEILSVYSEGFAVFSTKGEKLWSRESTVRSIGDHKRSLNGIGLQYW